MLPWLLIYFSLLLVTLAMPPFRHATRRYAAAMIRWFRLRHMPCFDAASATRYFGADAIRYIDAYDNVTIMLYGYDAADTARGTNNRQASPICRAVLFAIFMPPFSLPPLYAVAQKMLLFHMISFGNIHFSCWFEAKTSARHVHGHGANAAKYVCSMAR